MPFNVALSGLKAATTDLDVTGNNISNASTVGFKRSRTEFSDLYSNSFLSSGSSAVGDGVQVQNVRQLFSQGNISFTDNGLDLAINGNGMYVMNDGGERKYTRAGQFGIDRNGLMVNNSGMVLQGFQADSDGNIGGVIGDIQINSSDLSPSPTGSVTLDINLDASENVLENRGTTVTSNNGTAIGIAQFGTNNLYPATSYTVNLANGTSPTISTALNESASSIAAKFSALSGVNASATTTARIQSSNYTNSSNTMAITVNGIIFTPSSPATQTASEELIDLGNQINSSALVGITASIDSATNDLVITQNQGQNILFGFTGTGADSFTIAGSNTGTTRTVNSSNTNAVSGGIVTLTLDDGVTVTEPAASGSLFSSLDMQGTAFISNSFDPTDAATYNHTTSTTIFDSLGNSHAMTLYFVKQSQNVTNPNTWIVRVQIDGEEVGAPIASGQPASPANFTVVFNDDGTLNKTLSADPVITNWTPLDSQGNPNGALANPTFSSTVTDPATTSAFAINLDNMTQFGSSFAVSDIQQNGFATGRLVGLDVDESGVLFARYTNGQSLVLSQIVLANFNNEEALSPVGDTAWVETFDSGNAVIGNPGTGTLGSISASSIEESNVDISQELVNLIIAQRNFQANSKTIETANTITQSILQI